MSIPLEADSTISNEEDIAFNEFFALAIARMQLTILEISGWTSLHRSFLYRILNGESLPSPKALCRLTYFIGMTAEEAFIAVTPISSIISGEKDKRAMLHLKKRLKEKLGNMQKLSDQQRTVFNDMAKRLSQEKKQVAH